MTKIQRDKSLNERAADLRKSMTPQERHLWYDCLRFYPVKFYRQRVIGHFIVDFYCAKAGLVVEVDGSQHFECEVACADMERDAALTAMGLKVLRVSNVDINTRFDAVCAAIDGVVKQSMK